MKVCIQINAALNYGSTGRIAENIAKSVENAGWDSYIVHGPRYVKPSSIKSICTESSFEEKLHGIKSFFEDGHGLGSKRSTLRVINEIRKIDPDIIHLHNIHGYYLNYPILFGFLKEYKKPIIWTFHDCWNFTGHCAYFDMVKCEKWKSKCYGCPQIYSYPKSIVDNSSRNYDLKKKSFTGIDNLTIVPVSNWLSDIIGESFLGGYERRVIYNGIDTNCFCIKNKTSEIRKKYNLGNKFIILGVASPWSNRKGFVDFVKLSKMLDANYVILLVGLSDKQIKSLPPNIIGICRTDSVDSLADLYSSADIFLNLTYEDNFPTTNLEAMSCGTPVLTYKTGGSPEAISSETGFVVRQGDLCEVKDIIEKFNNVDRNAYSDICRKRVIENFKKEDRYKEYVDLYNEMLNIKNKYVSIQR